MSSSHGDSGYDQGNAASPKVSASPTLAPASGRPRKQVGWAGAVNVEQAAAIANSSSSSEPQSAAPTITPTLPSQANDDYLRSELTRIMSSPQPSSPQLILPSDSPQQSTFPRRAPDLVRPKPALRSGTATPALATPPDEQDVQNLELKKESAARAQLNAMRTIDDLQATVDPEDLEPVESRGRSRKRPASRLGFFDFHRRARSVSSEDTVVPEHDEEGNYIEKPRTYLSGGLSALHMLQTIGNRPQTPSVPSSADNSRASSPVSSFRRRHQKSSSMASLIGASTGVATRPGLTHSVSSDYLQPHQMKRPANPRSDSAHSFVSRVTRPILGSRSNSWDEKQITIQKHIRELVQRQRYIVRLCKALMLYGAPTHRLEEYMKMTARVIEIKAQFLYVPGCMIMSFDDPKTHTAEIRLVKVTQGVDLGKMWDTHDIYKDVVHDHIGVEEAIQRLDVIMNKPDKFKVWFLVFVHGIASMSVAPFAFQARYIDLGPAFLLGIILGFLRLVVAPASTLYTDIFEIVAVGITSFLARVFGSIKYNDAAHTEVFCFSALAQSSIALILPGFHVLCGALELQSKSMVAGSVRLVYAVIFSLFVGFALTIGTAVYGFMDGAATTATTCKNPITGPLLFPWVIIYSISLMLVNQAKFKHMPIMLIIAFAGYIVNYYSGQNFSGSTQLSSTLGAVTLSVFANLYSRVGSRVERGCEVAFAWVYVRTSRFWPKMLRKQVNEPKLEEISASAERSDSSDDEFSKEKSRSQRSSIVAAFDFVKAAILNPKEALARSNDDDPAADEPTTESAIAEEGQEKKPEEAPKTTQPRHVNYSLAAAAMLPGIFVLVPSGIAVQGSLVQGINDAGSIVNITRHENSTDLTGQTPTSDISLNVGYTVIQVAIALTVGLFIGSIIVYPFGKGGRGSRGMRSGLFSF